MKRYLYAALLLLMFPAIGVADPVVTRITPKAKAGIEGFQPKFLKINPEISIDAVSEGLSTFVLDVGTCSSMEMSSTDPSIQYKEARVCRVTIPEGARVAKIRFYARDYSGLGTYSDVIQTTSSVKVDLVESFVRERQAAQADWNCRREGEESSTFNLSEGMSSFVCSDNVKQAGSDLALHLASNVNIGIATASGGYLRANKNYFLPIVHLLEIQYSLPR